MAKPYYTQMTYGNVVTGKYILRRFDTEQVKAMYEDFRTCVVEHGYTYIGPITFYLERLEDRWTRVCIFVPTKEYIPLKNEKLGFESFYGQEHVICIQISLNEYKDIDKFLKMMVKKCEQDGYQLYGPLYYVFVPDDKEPYFLLKMGCISEI